MASNFLNKIQSRYKKIVKKPYYYVPPCPSCGNTMTGRIIEQKSSYEGEWIIDECLKNGELCVIVPEKGAADSYCAACGATFFGDVQLKMLSLAEIDEQRALRMTKMVLNQRIQEQEEKEKEKKEKNGVVVNSFSNFIGKI